MAYKEISVEEIPQELKDYAQRYIDKTKVVTYMRPTAYTSFIEGALFAMGMYISHKDKDYKNIKNDIHKIAS